jgi:hypothetical protein
VSDLAAMVAFLAARLDEQERTVYRAGTPPHGVIAWLTYQQPDGSMGYTTVAAGDSPHGPWFADGKELPAPASVLVVHDPARELRDVAAKRAILARWRELDARRGDNAEDEARAWLANEIVANLAAADSAHPEYDERWKP